MLFGTLAMQLHFVTRDQLIAATSEWTLDKSRPLRGVFLAKGILTEQESQVIDGVVRKHLEKNGNDIRKSLQSIEGYEDIRATLSHLDPPDLKETQNFKSLETPSYDPYVTQAPRPVETASAEARYSILRPHQQGGLGKVSIALDEELNREVALKEILSAQADSEENRSRFILEAEITGALEHPGVVSVYSLGYYADGRPYYAMRFIHGINLQVAIDQYHETEGNPGAKQLEFRKLLGRVVDVCHAIEYAHSRGVLHRDIKPGNIMLGDYGETLVVDWGVAKTLGEDFQSPPTVAEPPVHPTIRASSTKTQVGRVVGTPAYMSPEQAAGRIKSLGPATDIYSLGTTLYHLLTGVVPFQGTEEEILGNVQIGRYQQPRKVNRQTPRALEAICLKAMARSPKDRYASARAMGEDIERYLADEHVLAYAEPLPAKMWRWIRNHRTLVLSSVAAMTVAMAALSAGIILLGAANVRERILRAEAEMHRERAERNFSMAREAVRDYYIAVSEDTLLKQRGMQPLRDSLLRQALDYYQQFLDQREADPGLRVEIAQAHFYAGRITETIDSADKALEHYHQAAELFEQILDDTPDDEQMQFEYGQTCNAVGRANQKLGHMKQAREAYEHAHRVARKAGYRPSRQRGIWPHACQ